MRSVHLMTSANDTAVLIAAYNAAQTLSRAVESALAQPETAEVCVIDDGSQDDTRALAQAWAERDSRVMLLAQSNAGPGAARNSAIAATSAPWLAVLDADDYWLPGRLDRLFSHSTDADFICDALIRVPEHAAAPARAIGEAPGKRLTFEAFVLGNLGALKGPLDLGFLKPLMRRSFVDAHGLRYRPELRLGEDYEMYARALAHGARFLLTPPAGYVSVERAGSLSRDHGEEELRRLRDCDEELALIRPLRPPERRALARHTASVDCRLQWVRLIRAVKTRDISTALSTLRSPSVALYLAARLAEQAWLRSAGSIRGLLSMNGPTVRA